MVGQDTHCSNNYQVYTDIRTVDGPIPQAFPALAEVGMAVFTKIEVIIIFTSIFFAPVVTVAVLGLYLGNLYSKSQLSEKHEMRYIYLMYLMLLSSAFLNNMSFSNARSPFLAHFNAAILLE